MQGCKDARTQGRRDAQKRQHAQACLSMRLIERRPCATDTHEKLRRLVWEHGEVSSLRCRKHVEVRWILRRLHYLLPVTLHYSQESSSQQKRGDSRTIVWISPRRCSQFSRLDISKCQSDGAQLLEEPLLISTWGMPFESSKSRGAGPTFPDRTCVFTYFSYVVHFSRSNSRKPTALQAKSDAVPPLPWCRRWSSQRAIAMPCCHTWIRDRRCIRTRGKYASLTQQESTRGKNPRVEKLENFP